MNGAVEAYWDEGANGRPRKYYRITKKGRGLLREKMKEWDEFRKAISNVLGVQRWQNS
jgi:DNA-binding PadR family transcriptional regulator